MYIFILTLIFDKKPLHYVHIDKPKTLQEYRQVQYNNWCKVKGVYNGSYLPKNPNKLMESGKKGWRETTSPYDKTGTHRTFQRKSSGQVVDFHYRKIMKNNKIADDHYHWKRTIFVNDINKKSKYFDRYGKICKNNSKESHLAPLDKDFDYK